MLLATVLHGSRLYGTHHAQSDHDYREIVMPSLDDLMRRKAHNGRTCLDNIDIQRVSLFQFCEHLKDSQPYAVELVFAPSSAIIHSSPAWEAIIRNRHLYLTGNVDHFRSAARTDLRMYARNGSEKCLKQAKRLVHEAKVYRTTGKLEFPLPDLDAMLEQDPQEDVRELPSYQFVPDHVAADAITRQIYSGLLGLPCRL
jgi:predicted nucleotidyltransferase